MQTKYQIQSSNTNGAQSKVQKTKNFNSYHEIMQSQNVVFRIRLCACECAHLIGVAKNNKQTGAQANEMKTRYRGSVWLGLGSSSCQIIPNYRCCNCDNNLTSNILYIQNQLIAIIVQHTMICIIEYCSFHIH